jgi:hypothetical protein
MGAPVVDRSDHEILRERAGFHERGGLLYMRPPDLEDDNP